MDRQTKKNLLIWGMIALVVLNLASLTTVVWLKNRNERKEGHPYRLPRTQPGDAGYERRKYSRQDGHRSARYMRHGLDLTATQQQQFDSIWEHYSNKRYRMEKELADLRRQLAGLLAQPRVDTVAFNRLSARQGELMTALNRELLHMSLDLRHILDANQLQAFLKKMQRLHRRHLYRQHRPAYRDTLKAGPS